MYITWMDNKVILATHKITLSFEIIDSNPELLSELQFFQREEFGYVVYSENEKVKICDILDGYNITYDIEELKYDTEILEKVATKRYNSRSEALEDLSYDNLSLEEYKEKKIKRLQELRYRELCSGFFSNAIGTTPVEFSYDELAQQRFTKQATLLSINPNITEVEWKTKHNGFIVVDRETFLQILDDAAKHEMDVEFKYLYAEASIYNAEDKETIDSIVENY